MQKRLDELKRYRNIKSESVEHIRKIRKVRDSRSPASHKYSVRDSRSPAPLEMINMVDNDLPEQVAGCWGDEPEVGKISYFDLHP